MRTGHEQLNQVLGKEQPDQILGHKQLNQVLGNEQPDQILGPKQLNQVLGTRSKAPAAGFPGNKDSYYEE